MTEEHARAICTWRHQPPFSLYDLYEADVGLLLSPDLDYHAVTDAEGALAGFACYGDDAQVLGGDYAEEALDLGLCMNPDRIGRGEGRAFVAAVCAFGCRAFRPHTLRLSVAVFNRRAVWVYRQVGFAARNWFVGATRHGSFGFVVMTRPAAEPFAAAPAADA